MRRGQKATGACRDGNFKNPMVDIRDEGGHQAEEEGLLGLVVGRSHGEGFLAGLKKFLAVCQMALERKAGFSPVGAEPAGPTADPVWRCIWFGGRSILRSF